MNRAFFSLTGILIKCPGSELGIVLRHLEDGTVPDTPGRIKGLIEAINRDITPDDKITLLDVLRAKIDELFIFKNADLFAEKVMRLRREGDVTRGLVDPSFVAETKGGRLLVKIARSFNGNLQQRIQNRLKPHTAMNIYSFISDLWGYELAKNQLPGMFRGSNNMPEVFRNIIAEANRYSPADFLILENAVERMIQIEDPSFLSGPVRSNRRLVRRHAPY